jgi:hypothetical protein
MKDLILRGRSSGAFEGRLRKVGFPLDGLPQVKACLPYVGAAIGTMKPSIIQDIKRVVGSAKAVLFEPDDTEAAQLDAFTDKLQKFSSAETAVALGFVLANVSTSGMNCGIRALDLIHRASGGGGIVPDQDESHACVGGDTSLIFRPLSTCVFNNGLYGHV